MTTTWARLRVNPVKLSQSELSQQVVACSSREYDAPRHGEIRMQRCLVALAGSALVLASCGQKESNSPPSVAVTEAPIETTARPTPVLHHYYEEEERGVYYYVGAVSEEDRKNGKAAGEVYGFRYLGKNGEDQHVLTSVADNGRVIYKAFCSDPCKIIRYGDGERVGYNPNSIIGAAFADAMSGALKSTSPETVGESTSYPRTVSSIPKVFIGAWDEIIEDGCKSREARFVLAAKKFYNFEVEYDVTSVELFSANEIDLHTTTTDDNGSQINEVWQFKLADGGKALTGRAKGGTIFRRCPIN